MTKDSDSTVFGQFTNIGLPIDSKLKERYIIKEYVAIGHANLTYLAENSKSHEKVVIKEFCPYDYSNRDLDGKSVICKGDCFRKDYQAAKQLFEQECQIHKKISAYPEKLRKNIVKYVEDFEENHTKYLVLQFIPGMDLYRCMKQKKVMHFKKVARQILRAVMQIHRMGIIHKDLKPSNIVLGNDGKVYIIDLATAQLKSEANAVVRLGSRGFSAPELYQNGTTSVKTDIYSVGAIFYYMLVGRLLENGDERLLEDTVSPISDYIHLPWLLEWAIMKCIQVDPKKRWNHLKILYVLLI